MDRKLRSALARQDLAFAEGDSAPHIPYAAHLSESVIRTEAGDLVMTLQLQGISVETLSEDEISILKEARNNVFKGIAATDLAVWFHLVRRRESSYPAGEFASPYARDLDQRWREHRRTREYFRNELYISLVRRGPAERSSWQRTLVQTVFPWTAAKGAKQEEEARQRYFAKALADLADLGQKVRSNLSRYRPVILSIQERDGVLYSEPLRFLNGLISGHWGPVAAPRMHLKKFLAPSRLAFGLNRANLDVLERHAPNGATQFGGILGIKEYMPATAPIMMDAFLVAPTELVVSQSFVFQSRAGTLEAMRRQRNRFANAADAAESLAADLDTARDDLASSRFAWGEHQFSCMVLAATPAALKEAVSRVSTDLLDTGMQVVRESRNLELAFWAALPGNAVYRTRHAGISTANLASFISLHAYASGSPDRNHWGPAVCALETRSGTPYYFSYHLGDIGHTIIVGPSGTGKTTTALFMAIQAGRVGPRLFVFDRDRGAEIAVRALGGRYTIVAAGAPTGWNPFAFDGTPRHRAFLRDFLAQLVEHERPLSAADRDAIAKAVDRMYDLDPGDRRMARLAALIPRTGDPNGIDARFSSYYGSGEWSWLFDNATDNLSLTADVLGFDLTAVLRDRATSAATLTYLFYQVNRQRDGRKTLLFVDEGWYALKMNAFQQVLQEWYKTGRKEEIVLNFATQETGDALRSDIAQTIIQQSPTHIFFPNPKANRDEMIGGFKLTEREFELVQRVLPETRCFLVKKGSESTVVKLDLSALPGDIAVLSGRRESVEYLDRLREKLGDDPAIWLPTFLERANT